MRFFVATSILGLALVGMIWCAFRLNASTEMTDPHYRQVSWEGEKACIVVFVVAGLYDLRGLIKHLRNKRIQKLNRMLEIL